MRTAAKPQYRTLVGALSDLHDAVRIAYGPTDVNTPPLGERMKGLQKAVDRAGEVIERARAASAEQRERREAAKRRKIEEQAASFLM